MGRPKNIESPERFWEYFSEYEQWVKENPRYENVLIHKTGEIIPVPRERPMTWEGFDTWLADNKNILTGSRTYRENTNNAYEEFLGVITRARDKMYANKVEGASVGIFQHNIMAMELGMKNKSEIKIRKEEEPTKEEIDARIEQLRSLL